MHENTALSTPDGAPLDAVPPSRERILEQAGPAAASIHAMVRQILDDLETAAPWEALYYPPLDVEQFLRMESSLVAVIGGIPRRVEELVQKLGGGAPESVPDGELDELLGDLDFFFSGIHMSVKQELDKLRHKLESIETRDPAAGMTPQERIFICEVSADLKGKYSSSIMGAAASLIARERWNGVEIEPLLFQEKAEEFERNERLLETLTEVTGTITGLLGEVPLAEIVATWKRGRRVDQYALTPLYSFLGSLGKLMQVSSRRALYSGDYHQIQRRENLLSPLINELTTLHNMTWGTALQGSQLELDAVYPVMVRKATELAAILDVEILKKTIGAKTVDDLRLIVTLEKEEAKRQDRELPEDELAAHPRRAKLPEELHPIIPLLYDEDLKTFLDLLLGSVLKRASLNVRRHEPEPEAAATAVADADEPIDDATVLAPIPDGSAFTAGQAGAGPAAPGSAGRDLDATGSATPDLDATNSALFGPDDTGAATPGAAAGSETARLEALQEICRVLSELLARSNSHRKSFELIRRLLKQGRTVPPAMVQSMQPYLHDMMNRLIPLLGEGGALGATFSNYGASLFEYCMMLCDPELDAEQMRGEVPATIEKLLTLLKGLTAATASSIEDVTGDSPMAGLLVEAGDLFR